MIKINVYNNCLKILLFNACLYTAGYNIHAFAQSDPLTFQERASIKKCGLICIVDENVSFDIDINSNYTYLGEGFYLGMAGTISGALSAAQKEISIERYESAKLINLMQGWSFSQVFVNTLKNILKEAPFEVIILSDTITQKQVRKNKSEYLKAGLNTIMDIKVNRFGIQAVGNDLFTVFVTVYIRIRDITNNTIIAHRLIEYNNNCALENYYEDIKWYLSTEDCRNKEVSPNNLLLNPIAETNYDSFVENKGELLKKQLKIAALETCREIFSFLFLSDYRKKDWMNDYRLMPQGY